jgi:hypothetical protein
MPLTRIAAYAGYAMQSMPAAARIIPITASHFLEILNFIIPSFRIG